MNKETEGSLLLGMLNTSEFKSVFEVDGKVGLKSKEMESIFLSETFRIF